MSQPSETSHQKPSKQTETTLLGWAFGIALIALLLLMATYYYAMAHRSNVLNSAASDILSLLSAIRTWEGSQGSYETFTLGELYKVGLMPEAFNQVNPSTGKSLAIGPTWAECTSSIDLNPTNKGVEVTFSKLNPIICKDLIKRLTAQRNQADWMQIDHATHCGKDPCAAVLKVWVMHIGDNLP